MSSFVDKLRLNSLYPTPGPQQQQPDMINRFLSDIVPAMERRDRLSQLGDEALYQQRRSESMIQVPGGATPPTEYQYQPTVMDQARSVNTAKSVFGEDATNPQATQQKAQLELKEKELALKGHKIDTDAEIARQGMVNKQRMTEIADFKAKNPGVRIVAVSGGKVQAINTATGEVVKDFGDSGTMSESDKLALENTHKLGQITAQGDQTVRAEGVRREGQESLEEIKARHAKELANLNAGNKPTGSTKVETVKDKDGNIVEAKTTKTSDQFTPKTVMMFGPNGEGPYPVPEDKVETYKTSHKMSTTKPSGAAPTTKSAPLTRFAPSRSH